MRITSFHFKGCLLFVFLIIAGCSGNAQTATESSTAVPPTRQATRQPAEISSQEDTATPTSIPKPSATAIPTQDQFMISSHNSEQLVRLARFGGPPFGKITSATWSADGRWLHTTGTDSDGIYEAATLELHQTIPTNDFFAFLDAGTTYVVSSSGSLQFIETSSGSLQNEILLPNLEGEVSQISPKGNHLSSQTFTNQVTIWNLETAEIVQVINLNDFFEMEIEQIANQVFNEDGAFLFVSTNAGGVYRVEVGTGEVERLYQAAFIPDPTRITNTPAECFSPAANGRYLVMLCARYTASADAGSIASSFYTVKWIDLNVDDDQLTSFETRNSLDDPSLSPDGRSLYLQGIGEFKLLQKYPDGIEITTEPDCLAHSVDPFSLGPTGSGQAAVINSYERGEIFICDVESGERGAALEFEPLTSLALGISGGEYMAAVGRCTGRVELWKPETGQLVNSFPAHEGCITNLQFSRDGIFLVSGGEDGQVSLWDMRTPGDPAVFSSAHGQAVEDLVLNHDGKQYASASRNQVQLWDTSNEELVFSKSLEQGNNVTFGRRNWLVVSDGSWLDWYDQDDLFTSHILDTGHLLLDPSSSYITALSPEQDWIGFFDVDSGNLMYSFDVRSPSIQAITMSLDGCTLIGVGEDELIKLWNLDPFEISSVIETGIDRHNQVVSAGISPDGHLVVLGTEDGSVQVWGIPGSLTSSPGATTVKDVCTGFTRPMPTATSTPRPTATPAAELPTPTPVEFSRNLFLTQPNLQGPDVQILQERLLELGFEQVGIADGIFGAMTDQAVRQFQADSSLVVDGVVGPLTWELLFGDN